MWQLSYWEIRDTSSQLRFWESVTSLGRLLRVRWRRVWRALEHLVKIGTGIRLFWSIFVVDNVLQASLDCWDFFTSPGSQQITLGRKAFSDRFCWRPWSRHILRRYIPVQRWSLLRHGENWQWQMNKRMRSKFFNPVKWISLYSFEWGMTWNSSRGTKEIPHQEKFHRQIHNNFNVN